MNISDKIYQIRPLVGYDSNQDIRDTLTFPYDFHRAVEFAIRKMCQKAKIVLKAIFIPFVENSKFVLSQLESAGASGFEIVAPKLVYVLTSDGSITEITEEEVESIVADTYNIDLELYRVAIRKLGLSTRVQSNLSINSQPAAGTYTSINAVSGANITLPSGTSTLNYYVINFSKADESKYSYAKITNVAGAVLTLDQTIETNTDYLWAVNDKIYIASSLPYLFTLLFQGLPKTNYFDTYTTIPIDDVYLDFIDSIAMEYLYDRIRGRFPEYNQVYLTQRNITKEIITEVKKLANKRTAFTKIKPYIPYVQDYGRPS